MTTITLHRSRWHGPDGSCHPDRLTAYPTDHACHSPTGILLDECYNSSEPVLASVPPGWHIALSRIGELVLYDDSGHHVDVGIDHGGDAWWASASGYGDLQLAADQPATT